MGRKARHGLTRSRTYKIWLGMRARCDSSHPRYGGRGIAVCQQWETFEGFLADVGEIAAGLQLDRIDNDGDYEPGNCRLVDAQTNANNRSTSRPLTIDGRTRTIAEWAADAGLPLETIKSRLRRGQEGESLLRPARERGHLLTHDGQTASIREWARRIGIPAQSIQSRLSRGWPLDRVLARTSRNKAEAPPPAQASPNFKHGHSNSPTYQAWRSMRNRCAHDPRYVGRGIRICDRWLEFAAFLADMGERPSGHTLDRIDPTEGYSPGNCRWATPKGQARNRTSSKSVCIEGETRTMAEWAELAGLKLETFQSRIRRGWTGRRLISPPVVSCVH